jgi:hypothetical protein
MTQSTYKHTKPCESCPWRIDKGADDIPGFSLPLAEALTATCPDERGFGPEFGAPMFACHHSKEHSEIPCAGWLAAVGERHPNVRIAVMEGRIDPRALEYAPDSPELHENYREVLTKLRGQ